MTDRNTPTGPPPGPQRGPAPPPALRRAVGGGRRAVLTHSLAALGGLGVGVLIGIVGSGGGPDPQPGATPSPPPTTSTSATHRSPESEPRRTPRPATGETVPGDGTFLVGEDISAGTYRSEGGADGAVPFCFWSRLRGTTGDPGDVIAADGSKGPVTVTVLASDKAFKSTGCKTWHKVN
ncbi:hypothetical protein ACF065_16745 [Streptomyces sp. NPDC015232]|uniref:hypothetical protein n=1 Tax=unclassified Streptomyces TaxID=2593676 RepID=UPI0036F87528